MLYKRFVGDLIALDFVISLKRSHKVTWCDIYPFRHVSMNKEKNMKWNDQKKKRTD